MTSSQVFIDQELAQFGWVESIATNSINDFQSPKSNIEEEEEETIGKKNSDPIDIFICHLIFYIIFCYCLFLYVVIDLGFGSFIKNKVTTLIKFENKSAIPAFSSTLLN